MDYLDRTGPLTDYSIVAIKQNSSDLPREFDDLISQIALGNRDAFRLVFERSSAKLLGVCLRILNDRAESEDALQEVYVKVWQRASTFQSGKASGMTWLISIARNHAIDRLRVRRPAGESIDGADQIEDDSPSPEAASLAASEFRRVHDCLGELDPKHTEAVKKTYLGGLTYREVADELNIPLNTVKTWIRRSLIALRECMNR